MNIPRFPLQWPAGWPRTKYPKGSRFGKWNSKPTIYQAITDIEHELSLLSKSGDQFVISTNLKLKQDGLPYSGQREPADQGVALYFKRDGKDVVIACDSFDKAGCNLTAIAKTIEALRGIERWGCTELLNKAFTGFQALPEKASIPNWYDFMDLPEHASEEEIVKRYRELAKKFHPDTGGNATMFQLLQNLYNHAMKQFKDK